MAANMDMMARAVFRNALFHHYIDGIAAGDDVEKWLKTHGGWFPDEQSDYGYGCLMPVADDPEAAFKDPAKAVEDAKPLMDRLSKTLGEDENADVLREVRDWLQGASGGASSSNLTEANLEARDFRLEFAHETLQSFKRDRSRSPLRIEPLPDAARVALDVVCSRDRDNRIESQRATIAGLRQELLARDAEIGNLQRGIGVTMGHVWMHHGRLHPEMAPNRERRESTETLHAFLARLNSELEHLNNSALRVGVNFPMDGEATDDEGEEDEEEDDDDDV